MKQLILYIHGKGGSAAECEHYRPLFSGWDVVGLKYRSETPWDAREEFSAAFERLSKGYDRVALIANSIGAYFAMHALSEKRIERAWMISPIVDMEGLILAMMGQAGVSESKLREEGTIRTGFGQTLSWEYLKYVRAATINWTVPTEILYGGRDELTPRAAVDAFTAEHGAVLTVMEQGGHWFHTTAEMDFLDRWITDSRKRIVLDTQRLRLRTTTRTEMEQLIGAERDDELRCAYQEMLEGCLTHPEQWAWYAVWLIEDRAGILLGDLSFKGLTSDGMVEIGYGILKECRGCGYASEAVQAAVLWAAEQPGVTRIEAETAPDNRVSQRVLEKCGFLPNGITGEEGPRFVWCGA